MPAIRHLILPVSVFLLRTPISEIPLSYIGGGMAALMCLIALAVGIKSEKGSILSGLITGMSALAGMFIATHGTLALSPLLALSSLEVYAIVLFLWSRLPGWYRLWHWDIWLTYGTLETLLTRLKPSSAGLEAWLACGFAIGASSKHVRKGVVGCITFVALLDLVTYILFNTLPIIGSVMMFIYIFFGSLVSLVLVKLVYIEKLVKGLIKLNNELD